MISLEKIFPVFLNAVMLLNYNGDSTLKQEIAPIKISININVCDYIWSYEKL